VNGRRFASRAATAVGSRLLRLADAATPPPTGPTLAGDRDVEWSWVAANLRHEPARVLDFGAGSGFLSLAAAHAGHEVVAVDLEPTQFQFESPRIDYRRGDLLEMTFEPESFDQVLNCSTIEHVGLASRYGSRSDAEGDLRAMGRLLTLLRPEGGMLLTLPVGLGGTFAPLHRVYDESRLQRLLEGFEIEREEYWAKPTGNKWRPVPRAVALEQAGSERYYGLGLLALRPARTGP
jgi:SAM-dependent methyltransferase